MDILFNFRVIFNSIIDRLCSDADLITNMWDCYDALDAGSKRVTSLIAALKRLVTEKPALLEVGGQMGGVGVQAESLLPSCGLDMAAAPPFQLF